MKQRPLIAIIACAGTTASMCGTAIAQTYDQGTIMRQRPRLDDASIASATDGWLSDSATPRFWAWPLNTIALQHVTDLSGQHPNMQVFAHMYLDQDGYKWDSLTNQYVIDTDALDTMAEYFATNVLLPRMASDGPDHIADGNYAICIQNFRRLSPHQHPDDNLDTSVSLYDVRDVDSNPSTSCTTWADIIAHDILNNKPAASYPDTASPWHSNSVALAQAAVQYLTEAIADEVESALGVGTFPAPARIFLDEESQRSHGLSDWNEVAELVSMATDPRWDSEALYGDYRLWDSTPPTYVDEVFAAQDFTDYYENFYLEPCNTGPAYGYPSVEHLPIQLAYISLLTAAYDGALAAELYYPETDPDWTGFKWSNYNSSIYYTPDYPKSSTHQKSVVQTGNPTNQFYGYLASSTMGSAPIQSPVLYRPWEAWEEELNTLGITTSAETPDEAWLRLSRTNLDHAIFSFIDFDSKGISGVPRHVSPWTNRLGVDGNPKSIVRDMYALYKAKGVNEFMLWGNNSLNINHPDPTVAAEAAEKLGIRCDNDEPATHQYNWDTTNDALAQVFDYNVIDVAEYPNLSGGDTIDSLSYRSVQFSEEHTHNFGTALAGGITVASAFVVTFSAGPVTTPSATYAFILEAIDGGGPWDGATYTVAIKNYTTNTLNTVNSTPTEYYSTSGRRAKFYDTDMMYDTADGWDYTFDDEGDMPMSSEVTDRKTIQRWDITLPISGGSLSDYISMSGEMEIHVLATHTTVPGVGETADPLRIDLVQLYETECENDNIPEPAEAHLPGDLNGDGVVDPADVAMFRFGNAASDLNGDGQADADDLAVIINAMNRN